MKTNSDNEHTQECTCCRKDTKTDKNQQEVKKSSGIKGIFKGIICLLFGHDWVSYNEHAWICSRCMEVAPKG